MIFLHRNYAAPCDTCFPVLDPRAKLDHFKRHWDDDLQDDVLNIAEKIVRLLSGTGFSPSDAHLF